MEEQTTSKRETGHGPTAVPGTSPDGGRGVDINNQTTQTTKMVMVKTASCSLVTSPTTLIGLMPPAMLGRDSLFVAGRFVQARIVCFTKVWPISFQEIILIKRIIKMVNNISYKSNMTHHRILTYVADKMKNPIEPAKIYCFLSLFFDKFERYGTHAFKRKMVS